MSVSACSPRRGSSTLLAVGFARTPGKVELTAQMIRIVFPYILFISLISLAGGVLNVYRRFAIPGVHAGAAQPLDHRRRAVPRAVLRSADHGARLGRARSAASRSSRCRSGRCAKIGMLPWPRFDWRDPGVRRVLLAMGPAVLGVSAAQISALINTQLAASLGDGRISWITYADRLMEFPERAARRRARHGAAAVARASTTATPTRTQYSALLDWGLRLAFLLALPAAVALWLLALPLIATLYQYGRFTANDVLQTRDALLGYSVGLLGIILVKILAPGFYARQKMKTPVKIAFVTVLVAQTLRVRPDVAGSATPASRSRRRIGACLNAAACCSGCLRRRGIYGRGPGWLRFVARIVVALCVLAGVLAGAGRPGVAWLGASLWPARRAALARSCAGGGRLLRALWLLGFRLARLQPARRRAAGPRVRRALTRGRAAASVAARRDAGSCGLVHSA